MFFVANLEDGIINKMNFFNNKDNAVEFFISEVSEFGIEPYDTMIDSGVFDGEDGFSVQWGMADSL